MPAGRGDGILPPIGGPPAPPGSARELSRKIRVLFVSDLNVHANAYARFKAFAELGCEVRGIASAPAGGDDRGFVEPGLAEKIAWRFGFPLDRLGVQRALVDAAQSWVPDLIWIEKGNAIRPETLRRLRHVAPRAVLASFSPDDMFVRHNRSVYYAWSLKHYDIVFTTKSYNAAPGELPALGAARVVFVDNFYDDRHHPIEVTAEDRGRLGADVSFIGTFERDRFDSMLFLAKNGVKVRVWGNGWEAKIGLHPDLAVEGKPVMNTATELAYTKSICSTRINLAFLRKINRDQQTDRSVVIPACGGFLLGERTAEHRRLFEEGTEAEFFASDEELLAKARYYLEHEERRAAIAAAGRRRCLDSGYSLKEKLRLMLRDALSIPRREPLAEAEFRVG